MPIPPFDEISNVLPPHLGAEGELADLSPFHCTAVEVVERFATSPARKRILEGLLNLRSELFRLQVEGFQWLAGSFVENIEAQERRDPRDIDAVTFVRRPLDPYELASIRNAEPTLGRRRLAKETYFVDHFWVSLGSKPDRLVEATRYWFGCYTHRRDRLWKGIVEVSVFDPGDDAKARELLRSRL